MREKGTDNIQVKIINEEIEEVEAKLKNLENQINQDNEKFKEMIAQRDHIQK